MHAQQTHEGIFLMIATTRSLGVTLLERIGNTPLLNLERLTAHLPGVQILGKAEWFNPGGSVKDRAASSIVLDAEQRGLLKFRQPDAGRALLDATSGNTGIAYAMLGAVLGPDTRVAHWYASVRTKSRVAQINPSYIWAHRHDQLYSALVSAILPDLPQGP